MSEFAGLAYYAEVPGVVFDIQRVGPSTGLPTRTAQGDIASDGAAVARRHQADPAHPELGRRVLHDGDGRLRPGRALPAARVRDERPRPRDEHVDGARRSRIRRRRSIAARCSTPRRQDARRRVGALQGRRRRRHPLPHDSRHRHAVVLHARIGPQRARPVQRAARRLPEATSIGWRGSTRPRRRYVPAPIVEDAEAEVGIIAYGTSHWAVIESRAQLEAEAGLKTAYMRLRAYPFPAEVDAFIARYPRVYLVEQNRDAQMRCCCATTCRRRRPTTCEACCTTTACRSTRGR